MADLSDIPAEVMKYFSSIGSDMGMGANGHFLVSHHQRKERKEQKNEEKTLSRERRATFDSANFER